MTGIYFGGRSYQKKLNLFSNYCEAQGNSHITDITPDFIRAYMLYLEETGHNEGGRHACYRAVRTFLYWWEEEFEPKDWKNPIRKVKAPRVPMELLKSVSQDDFERLLSTCDKSWHGKRDKAILLTLLNSGLRAAELGALNRVDLELATGALDIRQGKGRKPRVTFVGRQTRPNLRSAPANG